MTSDFPGAFGSAARADDGAKARGQMLPDAAMRLYKQQPSALGRWQREIFEARQKGEGQLAATLTRLQGDPEFARTVLPKLQAMTVGGASAAR